MIVKHSKFTLFLILLFLSLINCNEKDIQPNIYEGELIQNTEVFFQMGFLGDPTLMPKMSSNGKYLTYQNFQSEDQLQGIWVLDIETSEKRLLIENGLFPDWSPDGEWITFNLEQHIYKIRLDGTELTQLTFEGENFNPSFGNNLILYKSNTLSPSGLSFIWKMNIDGSNKQRLSYTPEIGEMIYPDINLENDMVVHSRFIGVGASEIYTMNISGSSEQRMTISPEINDNAPFFSPNGNQIVFYNKYGIQLLNVSGKSTQQLLRNDLYNSTNPKNVKRAICCASWFPDGKHIVYQRFEISKARFSNDQGMLVEGTMSFYKLNIELALQNLSE